MTPPSPPENHGWTPERQQMFCETLAAYGVVSQAADAVGLSRRSAYAFRASAKGRAFAQVWDEARAIACRAMIDEAVTLAFDGRVVQVIEDGTIVSERRRNSPARLLRTVERLRSPEVLGDARVVAAARDFERCLDLLEERQVFPVPSSDKAGLSPDVHRFFCEVLMGKDEGVDRAEPPCTANPEASTPSRHPELVSGSMPELQPEVQDEAWMLKQVQHDDGGDGGEWTDDWAGAVWEADNRDGQAHEPEPAPTGPHRWSPALQRAFCEALARCGNVDKACRAVGKGRTGAYALRHQPHGRAFAIAWDAALLVVSEEMLDTALELAREGSVDSYYKHGKLVRVRRTLAVDSMIDTIARVMALRGEAYPRAPTDFATSLARLASGETQAAIEQGVDTGFIFTEEMVHQARASFFEKW